MLIGNHYLEWKKIYNIIGSVLTILMAYKTLYWIIGLFFTRKFKPAKKKHKYGMYKNVLLSDPDLEKLKNEFPDDWEFRIERLSEYMESTGKK